MNAEFAKGFASMSLPAIAQEWQATKRVIAAVPDDQTGYTPAPKSMTALDLAWHIVSSDIWFLEGIANGEFAMGDSSKPESVKTAADCIAYYESKIDGALEAVDALSGETLAEPLSFFGVFNLPRAMYLQFQQKHSVHHRGQLSVYLRPMGAAVPSIYGGSADEPFQPAASEAAGA